MAFVSGTLDSVMEKVSGLSEVYGELLNTFSLSLTHRDSGKGWWPSPESTQKWNLDWVLSFSILLSLPCGFFLLQYYRQTPLGGKLVASRAQRVNEALFGTC